jgi:alpha-mannosidase
VTIRLIDGQSNIEVDWVVGPVPIDDGIGKEVIIQYNSTDLAVTASGDDSVPWYTDSNGREFQKRIRNFRPTWKLNPTEPISQNYVPINAAAYINATGTVGGVLQSSLFGVVVDRSQGVASQADGSLEIMLHRRLLEDDSRGVSEPMNETSSFTNCYGEDNCPWGIHRTGKPLVIRGTHYLRFDQVTDAVNNLAPLRALQNAVYSPLVPMVGELDGTVEQYIKTHVVKQSLMSGSLPEEVELSHAHVWKDNSFLIRLAHNFGVGDDNVNVHNVDVDLSTMFNLPVKVIDELSVTANQKRSDVKQLNWQTQSDAGTEQQVKHDATIRDNTVNIAPAEVRTFQLAWNI